MNPPASLSRAELPGPPWYRQLWPWLLFGAPGVVVLASLASAWLAVKSDDGLVAEDYYRRGLLINRKLAAEDPDRDAPTAATIDLVQGGGIAVRVRGLVDPLAHLRLVIDDPQQVRPEQVITLREAADGRWVGELPPQSSGRRIIRLETERWQFPITTVVGPITDLQLGPAGRRL